MLLLKGIAVSNLRFVKAESSFVHNLMTNTQFKQLAKVFVSSFMYSQINVLEPVSKAYVFCFHKTLETTFNNILRNAEIHGCLYNENTVLQQNRGEKGSCAPLSHKPNKDCSGSPDNF